MKLGATQTTPGNFGNAEWPDGPPPSHFDPAPPAVDLRRIHRTKPRILGPDKQVEEFELMRPITYRARLGRREFVVTVPQRDGRFTTDLTSVPALLTWLVPKSGAHLPAALVHDGLVLDRDGVQTYETSDGEPVDRIDADRVFRDAMRDTRVGLLRRWVVWAAVTVASLLLGPRRGWGWAQRAYFRLVVPATFLVILYLGLAATVELWDGHVSHVWNLPWMQGHWFLEAVGGLSGAVVIPMALALAWGRHWRAGAVSGVVLATLVHATIAVALVALGYQLAELLVNGRRRAPWVIGAFLVGAFAVFGWQMNWSQLG